MVLFKFCLWTVAKQAFVYAPLFGVTLNNIDMIGIMKASSKKGKIGYDCDRDTTVQSEQQGVRKFK